MNSGISLFSFLSRSESQGGEIEKREYVKSQIREKSNTVFISTRRKQEK